MRAFVDELAAIRRSRRAHAYRAPAPIPGAFVRELKVFEPGADEALGASEDLAPAELVKAAEALKPRLVDVEQRAEEAGAQRTASRTTSASFVPDAVRAPVFAEQLSTLDARCCAG